MSGVSAAMPRRFGLAGAVFHTFQKAGQSFKKVLLFDDLLLGL